MANNSDITVTAWPASVTIHDPAGTIIKVNDIDEAVSMLGHTARLAGGLIHVNQVAVGRDRKVDGPTITVTGSSEVALSATRADGNAYVISLSSWAANVQEPGRPDPWPLDVALPDDAITVAQQVADHRQQPVVVITRWVISAADRRPVRLAPAPSLIAGETAPGSSGRAVEAPPADYSDRPIPTGLPVPAGPPRPVGTRQAVSESGSARPVSSLGETSFLVTHSPAAPATAGLRGTINTLTGLRLAPSATELAEREDVEAVSRHHPGPRTIAVVNRKGGSNKTPTVALLAAVFARFSGASTIAWDNNESQGTLGWRTERGAHDRSVLDLIDSSTRMLDPGTSAAEIAGFVHHQTGDKFDVLRSDENDEGDHEITAEEVDIAHRVLSRYYRLILMDSGNTARAANWRAMIRHTTQLVVPVTAMEDRAEAARLTLRTLEARGGQDAELAANAVVIVSAADGMGKAPGRERVKRMRDEAYRIAEGFKPLVRDVVSVPYDPALVRGTIRYDALQPATRRAWLRAGAAVSQGL